MFVKRQNIVMYDASVYLTKLSANLTKFTISNSGMLYRKQAWYITKQKRLWSCMYSRDLKNLWVGQNFKWKVTRSYGIERLYFEILKGNSWFGTDTSRGWGMRDYQRRWCSGFIPIIEVERLKIFLLKKSILRAVGAQDFQDGAWNDHIEWMFGITQQRTF